MFKVAILQKHAIHAKIDKNIESKYVDDRVAYTNGKQEMIDIILNCKQIVDMNCQDWYIIQQKQGEYTHESKLIFRTLYVHVLRTYTAINMQGQCIRLQLVGLLVQCIKPGYKRRIYIYGILFTLEISHQTFNVWCDFFIFLQERGAKNE